MDLLRYKHDLSGLNEPLRSHGGLHEREVPFIINRENECQIDSNKQLYNYDAFYYAIMGAGSKLMKNIIRHESMRIAGKKIDTEETIEVEYPFTGEIIGTVPMGKAEHAKNALDIAAKYMCQN